MNLVSRKTAAVLLAGASSLVALTPAAMAQDRGDHRRHMEMHNSHAERGGNFHHFRFEHGRGRQHDGRAMFRMGRGNFFDLVCSENGAERLEHAFVSLSYRVDVTQDQQAAFDDLKSTALGAQSDFAETCTAARDAVKANGDAGLLQGMQTRLAIETARVEALETVLPKFEAFYNTLTEEQKTSLKPRQRQNAGNTQSAPPAPADEQTKG